MPTSINQKGYSKYTGQIDFGKEGEFKLSYYSLDNVGNSSQPKERNFIVDLKAPSTFHNINGVSEGNIISTATKVYFISEDSLSGVAKTFFKFDDNEFSDYDGKNLDKSSLSEGEHTLYYYSEDFVKNEEGIKEFKFYYDKTAPIMAADILEDRFISNDQVYFSGRTKLKITAVDNKVGVKQTLYSINDETYKAYTQPFYLPSVSGTHTVKYYSEDNLSNISKSNENGNSADEFKHNVSKVYVDLTGPDISRSYSGKYLRTRDTVFINKDTKIILKGEDPESGMQKLTYSMDGTTVETSYDSPFTIPETGFHTMDYYGYDNVNNRNVNHFFLFSDHKGPSIFHNFSIDPYSTNGGLDVYSADVILYLAATDDKVGLSKIYYKLNDGEFKEYKGKIIGLESEIKYELTIKAVDLLGNENESTVMFHTGI